MATVVNVANDETLVKDAYERAKGDWASLQTDQLLQVNLDLHHAAQTILGALPEIRALRERIKNVPELNLTAFDRLEDYVLALTFVQARYMLATQPPDDLTELYNEAAGLREQLTADAEALATRGLMDKRKLESLKGGSGYKNVGLDLQALSQELSSILPNIQGKTAITEEDLKAASQMATRLMRVVGVREQSPAVVAGLTEERQRAFTLVMNTYDETRAAITYLRRKEDDADSIAPPLYLGKASRKRATVPEVPAPAGQAAPGTPAGAVLPSVGLPLPPAAASPSATTNGTNGPFVA